MQTETSARKLTSQVRMHLAACEQEEFWPYGVRETGEGIIAAAAEEMRLRGRGVRDACWLVLGPAQARYPTPATVRCAFAAGQQLCHEEGQKEDMPLARTADMLIFTASRFAERHVSDLILSWRSVMQTLEATEPLDNSILVFGIRRCGVDHTRLLMNRLLAFCLTPDRHIFPLRVYRSILALRLAAGSSGRIFSELRDITDSFDRLLEEDRPWLENTRILR